MVRTVFITRSDIGWYSRHANAQARPRQLSRDTRLTLCVNEACRVPDDLASACERVIVYRRLRDVAARLEDRYDRVCTGFDFPCLWAGWRIGRRMRIPWTLFLWDPPSLSHRDRFPPLRWAIDLVFRWFARRCDKLVLNIHPGLLDEIGFRRDEIDGWRRSGKLELRMQDAFEGLVPSPIVDSPRYDFDVGILSVETKAKGKDLVAAALKKLPGATCAWVHDLPQEEAFAKLRRCRVLLVPYLPVPSLKWNYPLKLFEYLTLGRPILVSDNPGNAAVAERFPGRIRLFKSGDADDLAEKLKEEVSCL